MTGQGMRSRLVVVASLLPLVAIVGTGSSCSVYALQEVGADAQRRAREFFEAHPPE